MEYVLTDLIVIPGSLTAARYIDIILSDHVIPAAYGICPDFLFMQDIARPYTAAITIDFLIELQIPKMDWPAISLDLNPIGTLTGYIGLTYSTSSKSTSNPSATNRSPSRRVGQYTTGRHSQAREKYTKNVFRHLKRDTFRRFFLVSLKAGFWNSKKQEGVALVLYRTFFRFPYLLQKD